MRLHARVVSAVVLAVVMAGPAATSAVAQNLRYRVTITNLTGGQSFTPFAIATHSSDVRIFAAGTSATAELRSVAEEGATTPLVALLESLPEVREVVTGSGLLTPAVTAGYEIMGGGSYDRLSLVAMLIPTNDAFVGVQSVALPMGSAPVVVYASAYDAGTEKNDELCGSIPGPNFTECGGPGGGGQVGNGEGAVTVHNGVHGVGDLTEHLRDWNNPVAAITIQLLP